MKYAVLLLLLIGFNRVSAQPSDRVRDSLRDLSRKDHRLMMDRLGITELRPGPSGNPEAPNAANRDESKASPCTFLPDPLVFDNGGGVKTSQQWQLRRKELIDLFDSEIYGKTPETVPAVSWQVLEETDTTVGTYDVHVTQLRGEVDNTIYPDIDVTIDMELTVPSDTMLVPLILQFTWNLPAGWRRPPADGPTWEEQLLKQGWGFAKIYPTSYQADNGAGLTQGIIGLVNKGQPRKMDDWGTLKAWAWGAGRAMDYFETISAVDADRVVIEGLSRYGKAAIVTMAYDQRFAIGFIGSSGAGGTKIFRRIYGEQVENLASAGEYHWFAPNFIKYAGPLTPNDLPVDAHELIALCAPRPVFISSGSPDVEGHWIDARGMFLATAHASPVYELLGKTGLGTMKYPPEGAALMSGDLAFRQHEGGHTVGPNWPYFIEFAMRYFEP